MMPNQYLEDLRALAGQVHIASEHKYRIGDRYFTVAHQQAYQRWHLPLSNFGENTGDENQLRANLQSHLSGSLYACFYCTGQADSPSFEPLTGPPNARSDRQETIRALSEANQSVDRLDRYWTVYSIDSHGNTFVSKNGNIRHLAPSEWELDGNAALGLKVGAVVHLKMFKEDTTAQPVFYHVRSAALVSQQAEFTRLYFNTDYEGATVLVSEITRLFNRYKVPFMFKCLNQPELFTRADSAVLYLDKADFRFASTLLRQVLPKVRPFLKTPVPLFTRVLMPGVSFSEDPGGGQSFGMSRCTLIARGLVDAFYKEMDGPEQKLAAIEKVFRANGIDTGALYLRPNSKFPYDFTVFAL